MSFYDDIIRRLNYMDELLTNDLTQKSEPKHTFYAERVPSALDNSSNGYTVGSMWITNTSLNSEAFLCVSASNSSAEWTQIT